VRLDVGFDLVAGAMADLSDVLGRLVLLGVLLVVPSNFVLLTFSVTFPVSIFACYDSSLLAYLAES